MCTAISFRHNDHYFGRNLDLEFAYRESVTITPRHFSFPFRHLPSLNNHAALIGIATVADGYPLYYEATNEYGLSMAGLNFPGNAVYREPQQNALNLAPYELIPWLLGQFHTVAQAKAAIAKLNIANTPFSRSYPLSPLHWILSDQKESITLEPMDDGVRVFENAVGVLTNNPPFDYHIHNMNNYLNLTSKEPTNRFCPNLTLDVYSRGMGAVGLPGDLSSASRFIRAAFVKWNSRCEDCEDACVSQFFHILSSVSQPNGCTEVGGKYELTVYTSCCNTNRGIFYYTTYNNRQITAVDMHRENLDSAQLITYPLRTSQNIFKEN